MSLQFKFIPTPLNDVFLIENGKYIDARGSFIKLFNQELFLKNGLKANFQESYYSISQKNVLRGMHFQKHPHGHAKLVYVVEGEILDVIVCIKDGNVNHGKIYSTVLSSEDGKSLYIPDGYAHGFLVLSEKAIVINSLTSSHQDSHEAGIHFASFGFDWPVKNPIISEKDRNQPSSLQ